MASGFETLQCEFAAAIGRCQGHGVSKPVACTDYVTVRETFVFEKEGLETVCAAAVVQLRPCVFIVSIHVVGMICVGSRER